jgi:hypothetical protein
MADSVQCARHGEHQKTYVCTHLAGEEVGLGFNTSEPTRENPFPDAWCDDCELIRARQDGWNEASEKLTSIVLLCSDCYERARIRNTRTAVKLQDLANLRWKCGACEEWHCGPCLDLGYDSPYYWGEKDKAANVGARPVRVGRLPETFLNEDYCAIEDRDFFVRGIVELPIVGTKETFRWGVWGSLSRDNFRILLEMDEKPKRTELPRMFSWLSTQIADYPETLNLKMYAHIQAPGVRPQFELERADHPLSQEYYCGITPERVREITIKHAYETS